MKKFISALLAFILILTPVTAFATEEDVKPMEIKMGDVNLDGKISASDARTALRCSAKLESAENISMLSIDTDGDNRISAADARTILRVSAKLSSFTNGFNGNGLPCAIETIHSNVYYLDVENYDESTKTSLEFEVARKNSDVYMMSDDEAMMGSLGMGGNALNITKCGMMITGKKIYALMGTDKADIAMEIPKELQADLGMDTSTLNEIVDMISTLIPEKLGMPAPVEFDGQKGYCYTYSAAGQTCQLYITETGKLVKIDGVMENGNILTLLKFNEVSGDAPDKYFDLNSFDELW